MSQSTATKNTYTPGPWKVVRGHNCLHVVSEDTLFSTGCITFNGQGEANARLIAAAPDLLDIVRYVYDTLASGAPLYVTAQLPMQSCEVLGKIEGADVQEAPSQEPATS